MSVSPLLVHIGQCRARTAGLPFTNRECRHPAERGRERQPSGNQEESDEHVKPVPG